MMWLTVVLVGWPWILSSGMVDNCILIASRTAASVAVGDDIVSCIAQFRKLLITAEHSKYIDVDNQVIARL